MKVQDETGTEGEMLRPGDRVQELTAAGTTIRRTGRSGGCLADNAAAQDKLLYPESRRVSTGGPVLVPETHRSTREMTDAMAAENKVSEPVQNGASWAK